MGRFASWLASCGRRGTAARCALLTAAVLALSVALSPLAWALGGWWGIAAAGASAATCYVGSLAALLISDLLRKTSNAPAVALQSLVLGMLIRMAAPLGLALWVHSQSGVLSAAGFLYYLVVFYFATLAVDTALAVQAIPSPAATGQGAMPADPRSDRP
jgi:hypothetical protein